MTKNTKKHLRLSETIIGIPVFVIRISVLVLILIFIYAAVSGPLPVHAASAWYDNGPILHAAGGYNGSAYSNCKEALIKSLADRGGNVSIELDFSITRDKYLVCVHDWPSFNKEVNHLKTSSALTLKQFRKCRTLGNGTPMTAYEAVTIMSKYPNCYLIVDTKTTGMKVYRYLVKVCKNLHKTSFLKKQVVIQVYKKDEYKKIKRIYPFKHWSFSVYKCNFHKTSVLKSIRSFCLKKHFDAMIIPACAISTNTKDMALTKFEYSKKRFGALKYGKKIPVICHTVNDPALYQFLLQQGVKNIFTDYL